MASSAAVSARNSREMKRSTTEQNPAYKVVSKELRYLQSSVEHSSNERWSLAGKALVVGKTRKK